MAGNPLLNNDYKYKFLLMQQYLYDRPISRSDRDYRQESRIVDIALITPALLFQGRENAVYVCFKYDLLPKGASWLILVQATKNQGSFKLGNRKTSVVSWVLVRAHE